MLKLIFLLLLVKIILVPVVFWYFVLRGSAADQAQGTSGKNSRD